MNRRGRLGRIVIALVVGLMLIATACGGGGDDAGGGEGNEGPSGAPKKGGTLRYGVEAETSGLNPTTDRFAASVLPDGQRGVRPHHLPRRQGRVLALPRRVGHPERRPHRVDGQAAAGHQVPRRHPADLRGAARSPSSSRSPTRSSASRSSRSSGAENPVEIVDELTATLLHGRAERALPALHRRARSASSRRRRGCAPPRRTPTSTSDRSAPDRSSSRAAPRTPARSSCATTTGGTARSTSTAIEFVVQTDAARRADQLLADDLDVMHTSDPDDRRRCCATSPTSTRIEDDAGEEGFVMINTTARAVRRHPRAQGAGARDAEAGLPRGASARASPKSADSMFHPDLQVEQPRREAGGRQAGRGQEARRGVLRREARRCDGRQDQDEVQVHRAERGQPGPHRRHADQRLEGGVRRRAADQVLQDDYIVQVATGDYQVVTWRQFGSDDPEGEFVWHDCRSIAPGLSPSTGPGTATRTPRRCCESSGSPSDEDERIDDVAADRPEHQRGLHLRVPRAHQLVDRGAADVGGGIESALPGGGATGPGSRNGSHTVPQMWLDQ